MLFRRLLPLLAAAPARTLLRPGSTLGLLFARASGASALLADNATWAEYATGVARYSGSTQRLLIEGLRTNGVRNSRLEGGTAGSPGVLPTNWVRTGATGVSQTLAYNSASGIPGMDLTMSGTVGSGNTIYLFETPNAIAAAPGDIFCFSALLGLIGGDLTNVTGIQFRWSWNDAASSVIAAVNGLDLKGSLTSTTKQLFTLTAAAPANTAWVRPAILISYTNGAAINFTLRMAGTQSERNVAFPSTPILAAPGSPNAASRAPDLVSMPLVAGPCTFLGTTLIPQNAPSAANQSIVQLDDGTDNNRIRLRNVAGGATVVLGHVVGGVATDATSLGNMTAGTLLRWGITVSAAGRIAGCLNGGTVQAIAGAPSALPTLREGNSVAGTTATFGEHGYLIRRPYVSDAALPALVAGLSST